MHILRPHSQSEKVLSVYCTTEFWVFGLHHLDFGGLLEEGVCPAEISAENPVRQHQGFAQYVLKFPSIFILVRGLERFGADDLYLLISVKGN